MDRIKRGCLALAAALCCAALAGCGAPQRNTAVGFYLDTVITLTGYCSQEVLEEALSLCPEYESLFSRTMEDSDVWLINSAGGEPVEVSDHTIALLQGALELCEKSGGAFDVTIAPAVEMWDFKSGTALPDAEKLKRAAELVDYTRIKIEGNTVRLPEGMALDLGGIGKGYVADRIVEYLAGRGVESAIVNLGGNVAALGRKPDGSPWSVGIQDPGRRTGEYFALAEAADCSVVTSGVYERGFELNGVRYHHILDTDTGWPVQNGLASVTIIAGDSMLADGLSTACFALGIEEGLKLAQDMGAEAAFLTESGELACTSGMEEMLELC